MNNEKELEGYLNEFQYSREKVKESLALTGYAGTHVGLNEKGDVVVKTLSADEILKLLSLYDNIKDIPDEYTIYKEDEL